MQGLVLSRWNPLLAFHVVPQCTPTLPSDRAREFDPFARPMDWYRLPLAIKLAVINLWRVEQDPAQPKDEPTSTSKDR